MIRKANINDVTFIHELSKENLETSFKKETLKEYILKDETYHLFVLEEDELIGFIIIWQSEEFSQIIDLVIDTKFRRLGYGKKLVSYAITYLSNKGAKSLSLEVSINNKEAINLYEKLGFKKERVLKNYYNNSDGFLYVRSI